MPQPTEPDPLPADRPVVTVRTMEFIVSGAFFLLAVFLAFENWKLGASWSATGPESGYFPFYLSLMLGGAAVTGLINAVRMAPRDEAGRPAAFVNYDQFRRVLQVLIPSFLFVLAVQFLGIYVASLIFVTGFMIGIGKAPIWKAVLTALLFGLFLFFVFEVQFTVIMPKGPLEAYFGY